MLPLKRILLKGIRTSDSSRAWTLHVLTYPSPSPPLLPTLQEQFEVTAQERHHRALQGGRPGRRRASSMTIWRPRLALLGCWGIRAEHRPCHIL